VTSSVARAGVMISASGHQIVALGGVGTDLQQGEWPLLLQWTKTPLRQMILFGHGNHGGMLWAPWPLGPPRFEMIQRVREVYDARVLFEDDGASEHFRSEAPGACEPADVRNSMTRMPFPGARRFA